VGAIAEVGDDYLRKNLLGRSPCFCRAIEQLMRFATCEAPVLIVGETGTGKELAARAMHYLSARRDSAFIPVNCASLPDGLVESELFGHARGAFTDASRAHRGLVRQADAGTLFLDEVEALAPHAQASLLRFLQDSTYRPVGGESYQQANVRVISASNLDLLAQVKARTFREDLLYRLEVLRVELPPLRERPEDIELLALHLLRKAASRTGDRPKCISQEALSALRAFGWPGNVRQLEHTLLRVHLLCGADEISRDDLLSCAPDLGHGIAAGDVSANDSLREAKRIAVDQVERQYVVGVLSRAMGNISEAARLCGMQRASFSKLVKKHRAVAL
jgi:DNA-binding NtrC family response regulator